MSFTVVFVGTMEQGCLRSTFFCLALLHAKEKSHDKLVRVATVCVRGLNTRQLS